MGSRSELKLQDGGQVVVGTWWGILGTQLVTSIVFMNQKNIPMSETWRDSSCGSRVYVPSSHPSGTFKAAF